MFKTLSCKITGVAPLIQHNGQLADARNPFAKEMKKLSGKRNKTDADLEELARFEWHGSLYLTDGRPCLPGELLEAHLIEAAKKRKQGPQARAGLYCDGTFPLLYDGPTALDDLWEDERFRLTTGARVQRNRVMRTRPIFQEWALAFEVIYNSSMLNPDDICQFLRIGGEQIGLGDWRPRFGRYTVDETTV